jgi:hypothetical protein
MKRNTTPLLLFSDDLEQYPFPPSAITLPKCQTRRSLAMALIPQLTLRDGRASKEAPLVPWNANKAPVLGASQTVEHGFACAAEVQGISALRVMSPTSRPPTGKPRVQADSAAWGCPHSPQWTYRSCSLARSILDATSSEIRLRPPATSRVGLLRVVQRLLRHALRQ